MISANPKVTAAQAYPKDLLTAFFGRFYATVGACAVVLHLFGTRHVLNRIGVVGALALLPASLGFGNAALAFFPVVASAAFSKGADTLFRYSVNDATTQLLYLPVSPHARASAKAFINGVVKSSGKPWRSAEGRMPKAESEPHRGFLLSAFSYHGPAIVGS